MCGICGILTLESGQQPTVAEIQSMAGLLVHRGPDDAGYFVDGPVGLGHRRLSIVDLSGGRQPMTNEDGSIQIIFNGEIYNHQELRKELERRGHRYRTRSDTESILHLYEEEGPNCVSKLRGMFAFAIWDGQRRRLFCARDRLGIKPFYYSVCRGRLIFASEIKALLELPEVSRQVNRSVLPEFLSFGYVSAPQTLFEGICKLLPGHWLLCEKNQITIHQYWDVRFPSSVSSRSAQDCVDEFSHLFTESVRLRLMSDVPLGVLLSGGLDSSSIAAMMSQLTGGQRIKTFSVGFTEENYDELIFARRVAKHLGTDHHEVVLSSQDFFAALPKLIWHEDEPVAWPSSVSLYFVARLASEHVKVILTGEGADELLAGYTRYWATLWNWRLGTIYCGLVPNGVRRSIRALLNDGTLPQSMTRKLRHTFLYHRSSDLGESYFDNFFSVFSLSDISELLVDSKQFAQPQDPYRNALRYAQQDGRPDRLAQLLYTDLKSYLVELLMKQDNMSMACSLESRVPFLDHVLVEAVCAMPSAVKLRGLRTKYVLREAMKDLLPPAILRRRKRGFPTPLRPWMRQYHPVIRAILLDRRLGDRQLLRPAAVRALLSLHESGKKDCTFSLWRLLNFELWCRLFFDRDGSEGVLGRHEESVVA